MVAASIVLGECFAGLPSFFLVLLASDMVGVIDLPFVGEAKILVLE
jgi:hypothetical protein